MSANLQYKELNGWLHHFGSFQGLGGVHQEQNYVSRPAKINGSYNPSFTSKLFLMV